MIIFSLLAVLIFSISNGTWLLLRIQNRHHPTWLSLGQPFSLNFCWWYCFFCLLRARLLNSR